MVMGSAWRKNNLRELRRSLGRWLAILAIIALGIGFFAGLKASKPAMLLTAEDYLGETGFYDFRLISTLGLTQEDVAAAAQTRGIAAAEGSVTADAVGTIGEDERTLKVLTLTDTVNRPKLTYGRLPQKADECLADMHRFSQKDVGSTVTISKASIDGCLTTDTFTIVGLCTSPLYLNVERGTTALGGGSIDGFLCIPKDAFALDYFTEVSVLLDGADRTLYCDAYTDAVSALRPTLEALLAQRAPLRYEQIVDDARAALSDAQAEYDRGVAEYQAQREDAEAQLAEAQRQLDSGAAQLEANRKKLDEAQLTLDQKEKELAAGEQEIPKGEAALAAAKEDAYRQLDEKQAQLDENRQQVDSGLLKVKLTGLPLQYETLLVTRLQLQGRLAVLEEGSADYNATQRMLDGTQRLIEQYEQGEVIPQYLKLKDAQAQLDDAQAQLDSARSEADRTFAAKEAELAAAKAQIESGKQQLADGRSELESGRAQLESAQAQLSQSRADYEAAQAAAQEGFAQAEAKLESGKRQLEKAQVEVEKIDHPSTYVLDRTVNTGYLSFRGDSSIVEGVARVFPLFFFLVAALVCITTMTRMVDEQRTQIGTLKALGYSDGAIAWKYISYSGSAALLGAIFGFMLGTWVFPQGIWQGYSMLYQFSSRLRYYFDPVMAAVSLAASLVCSVGATWFACHAELRLLPASLMRPKAPKPGKRILLERVRFIWSRVSFLHKVSIRNILRYKKRLFMMLLGIGGCTALIVAGFGIRDSIATIADDQFGSITHYDISMTFSTPMDTTLQEDFRSRYPTAQTCVFAETASYEIKNGSAVFTLNTVATDDPDITSVIGLTDGTQTVPYPQEGAIIDRDLADRLGLKVGDMLTVSLSDTKSVEIPVEGVFENYVYHYAYMTAETYERIFGESCTYKTAYLLTQDDAYALGASIADNPRVANVSVVDSLRELVRDMMKSLDYIVGLVIGSACALALVVLFNLCNISITERIREIATVKVLGFYRRETRFYVFREILMLSVLGALVGLPAGWALHRFIMSQIRVDMVSFLVRVAPLSYCLSFVITMLLSVLVCALLGRKIDRIQMAESLKSVE